MRKQRSSEIQFAFGGDARLFEALRDDFAEDHLLGEILRAHNHAGPIRAAGGDDYCQ
jgi:hypothetical protein